MTHPILSFEAQRLHCPQADRSAPNLLGFPPAKAHGGGKGGHTPGSARRTFVEPGAWLLGGTASGAKDEGDFAMPKHKDLKRLVRGRMQKTGESYTTARLHILQKSNGVLNGPTTKTPAAQAPAVKVPAQEPPPNYAAITRMSDESVQKATGCTWERWVKALDRDQAFQMSHREIAAHIHQKY